MGAYIGNCATRNSLEQHYFKLVSKFSALTSMLTQTIGQNYAAFLAVKADCEQARKELAHVRRQIQAHQVDHKCSPFSL